MEKDKKDSLDELKKNYSKLEKKYSLPGFDELNKDFAIERISDEKTLFLIREIRKFMAEKFSEYLRFIEGLLNPVNAPMFIFSVVKLLNANDKEKLSEAYKKLSFVGINLIELDLEFNEDKEAEFIKKGFNEWQKIKKDILKIIEEVKKNWNKKSEVNGKSYFG
ncbi:MAG: hypothetical protein PVJ67_05865 [Candidatus Pacearchaeota archaeon]|jgi:hypothetical protein